MSKSVSPTERVLVPFFSLRGIVAVIGIVGMLGGVSKAQTQGPSLRSDRQPIRVTVDPTYQYYDSEEGGALTQLSNSLAVFVPVTQRLSVRARGAYARMDGSGLDPTQGLTDISGRLSYAQPVGNGSIVFQVRANAPTGKDELTASELATTRPISQNFYDFRVTSFSRGSSIAPQVTWAVPLSDRLVVGIGGSYQYRRGFRPRERLSADYTPGDGVKVNGGMDYKITGSSAIGVNGTFRRYGEDTVGGVPRFDAGNQFSATLRYLRRSGFTSIRVLAQYASWEESRFGFRFGNPNRGQVIPEHGMLLSSYSARLTNDLDLRVRVSGHWYGETIQSDSKIFGRLYVSPAFEVGGGITLAPHGTAAYGSYVSLGGGLRIAGEF
ncbi:MAG: hypothetical protein BRD35_08030 [Bacteroidetes bacterium QH_7_62_13]|nr:MAG: hypothetical protein BRD35_08030 [Bacteroidetes bacterium QH_7_62_13]